MLRLMHAVVWTSAILIALFMFGCEGSQGPSGASSAAPVWVSGSVWSGNYWDDTPDVGVYVNNVLSIPSVYVNDVEILSYSGATSFHHENFPISPGDSIHLFISYLFPDESEGTLEADLVLPGEFQITSHDTSEPAYFPLGSDISFAWASSQKADVYSIDFHFHVNYYDSAGNHVSSSLQIDTLITDSAITFAGESLFPDSAEIDSVTYCHGDFDVFAISGSWQEGDPANVTGDGMGYFYGRTYGGHVDLYLEEP